jgi:hypothetical protein
LRSREPEDAKTVSSFGFRVASFRPPEHEPFKVQNSKFKVEEPSGRTAERQTAGKQESRKAEKQFQVPSSKFQVEEPGRPEAGRTYPIWPGFDINKPCFRMLQG